MPMPSSYKPYFQLQVSSLLAEFINNEVFPSLSLKISQQEFWQGFSILTRDLAKTNKHLLLERERLRDALNDWHTKNPGPITDLDHYKSYLRTIGYLQERPKSIEKILTAHIDHEMSLQAGPQLVVPISNARYALNAINARWGSLYDALYGSDVIEERSGLEKGDKYNVARGLEVVKYVRKFLDKVIPLDSQASHFAVDQYVVDAEGKLMAHLTAGNWVHLENPLALVGYQGAPDDPSGLLFKHNELHIQILINRHSAVGREDVSGVADVLVESALTTILDFEDSVSTVDAEDKVQAYRNWLGIVKGTLSVSMTKGDRSFHRSLNEDVFYTDARSKTLASLHGRSLLLIRNVGHLMTNPAILYQGDAGEWNEIPEGIMDAVVTSLIAVYDLQKNRDHPLRNSRCGSVYIVKPKMHGPEEVAFSCEIFRRVEGLLGLTENTLKIGIMDEERRTSLNLLACIEKAKYRVVFINTGFLDRTGDEIHTALCAGAVLRKGDMKHSDWIKAYELNNVASGLVSGFSKKAQIGKGMWAMPDLMALMMSTKIGQLKAGASTGWVPSPTAATLHALHYHEVDVFQQQDVLAEAISDLSIFDKYLDSLLQIPVLATPSWSQTEILEELNNNVQGILGYVVRWIDQGVGCSKVPDIYNVGLMEDRATLRISSQHIANWLRHGIVNREQVLQTFENMAKVVDEQNKMDMAYCPMAGHLSQSLAYQAALALVFEGEVETNGYTEPILHTYRLRHKNKVIG
ncbi:MAG: malate synthase G [Gammaproteobacteria bacterium]|nr:malate synthase G [Gammaproteobacteria bacterium]